MGHVFLHSPSDVFGSLISDTEEFLEDYQMNHRSSLGTNIYSPISQSPTTPPISPSPQFRLGTAPQKTANQTIPGQFSADELALLDSVSPCPSAPPALDTIAQRIAARNKAQTQEFQ